MDALRGSLTPHATIRGVLGSQQRIIGNMREGGGTSNYEELENLPAINGVELIGDQSAHDLGLALLTDLPNINYSTTPINTHIKWIDNRDVWQVVIPFNTMYNNMELLIPKPADSNINEVISIIGMAGGTDDYVATVPYYSNNNYNIRTYYYKVNESIYFETTSEQSQYYYDGYVIVKYTLL